VVFQTDGVDIVRTPIKAPRANAFAERWVKTVKSECLDWILIVGSRHLRAILQDYVEHYTVAASRTRAPVPQAVSTRSPPGSSRERSSKNSARRFD
jgi:hypothetical protein